MMVNFKQKPNPRTSSSFLWFTGSHRSIQILTLYLNVPRLKLTSLMQPNDDWNSFLTRLSNQHIFTFEVLYISATTARTTSPPICKKSSFGTHVRRHILSQCLTTNDWNFPLCKFATHGSRYKKFGILT